MYHRPLCRNECVRWGGRGGCSQVGNARIFSLSRTQRKNKNITKKEYKKDKTSTALGKGEAAAAAESPGTARASRRRNSAAAAAQGAESPSFCKSRRVFHETKQADSRGKKRGFRIRTKVDEQPFLRNTHKGKRMALPPLDAARQPPPRRRC